MKIDSTRKKLPLYIVIFALIIAATVVVFALLGFNVANELKDKTSVEVTYDAYITVDDDRRDELEEIAVSAIEESSGLTVVETVFSSESTGGSVQFFFGADVSTETLENALTAALNALSSSETLSAGTYQGSVHVYVAQYFYTYIWRGAIAIAASVIVAFIYVSIRFKLNMGITLAIITVHNVLLVLALSIICRLAFASTFIAAIGFALVYSLVNTILSLVYMRSTYADENVKVLPAEEQLEKACLSYRKPCYLLNEIVLLAMVFMCAVSVLGGVTAIATFAVAGVLCALVNFYSAKFVLPAVYIPLKEAADKRAAYKNSSEYKAKKQAAKGSDKDID